jgi:hypothetical protein
LYTKEYILYVFNFSLIGQIEGEGVREEARGKDSADHV